MNMPICPRCKEPMILRSGKNGKFYGCSTYPECIYTQAYISENTELEDQLRAAEEMAEYWKTKFYEERAWWIEVTKDKLGPVVPPLVEIPKIEEKKREHTSSR